MSIRKSKFESQIKFKLTHWLLLLPDATLADARTRAESLLAVKALKGNAARGGVAVTVSIGVAAFPDHGQQPEEILRAADAALYAAKEAGRDRVELPQFAALG